MIEKNIEEIKEKDLQDLVDNKVSEKKILEYKLILPGNSDKEKREFLADVSSFANASGGDIVYGVREDNKKGEPVELVGLEVDELGKKIEQLENILRDGIRPRIPSKEIETIKLSNQRVVIIIRIVKSWNSPHRVIFKGHDKFYSRNSKGKYPLDVDELRTAFTLSETITERIRNFRLDRISKINADETPVTLRKKPKIVIHILPLNSFLTLQNYSINTLETSSLEQIYSLGFNYRYNLEGYLTYHEIEEGNLSSSYVQIYRRGIIEAVETTLFNNVVDEFKIPIIYENYLVRFLSNYTDILKDLGVLPPLFVFLTLLGVKGYTMYRKNPHHFRINYIDRDILILPEGVIESYKDKPEYVLRDAFYSIWNACGEPQSTNYNVNGEWKPEVKIRD